MTTPRQFRVRAWPTGDVSVCGLHVPAGQQIVVQLDPGRKGLQVDRRTLELLSADTRLVVEEMEAPLDDAAATPERTARKRRT